MDAMIADLLWQRASEHLFVTREQYLAGLAGWDAARVEDGGELIAVTLTKGPEFHFMTTGKPIPRRIVR